MPHTNLHGGKIARSRIPAFHHRATRVVATICRRVRIFDLRINLLVACLLGLSVHSTGIAQELVQQSPNVYVVVIDISGSMEYPLPAPVQPQLAKTSKLQEVKRRLEMLAKYLPANSRVLVTSFDHDRFEICDITLKSDQDRRELTKAFQAIRGRRGSTHLWRTADLELTRAKAISSELKDGRVRVLLYTDGDDQEKKPGLDHKWILKKHGKDLQSSVALDWVTLGFDLKKSVKRDLEASGVVITPVLEPEDIALFRAEFRLSAKNVVVGEAVDFVDESLGLNIEKREISWGDGSERKVLRGLRVSHRFKRAGKYEVKYSIEGKDGKTSVAKSIVSVSLPPGLTPQFELIGEPYFVGEKIYFVDTTKGELKGRKWHFPDATKASSQKASFELKRSGTQKFSLTVVDIYGRSFSASRSIDVSTPPIAKLSIDCDRKKALVGETIVLTAKSVGSISDYRWSDGQKTYAGKELRLRFDKTGEQKISCVATDKFGRKLAQSHTIQIVLPLKPSAQINSSHKTAKIGEWVTFSFPHAPLETSQSWFVGSDKVVEGSTFRHRFDEIGQKEIRLVVEDKFGQTSESSFKVSVVPGRGPNAKIEYDNLEGFVGQTFKLTCPLRGVGLRYRWSAAGTSSDQPVFLLIPKTEGKIDVQLTVTDRFGQSDESKVQLNVRLPEPPIASFRYDSGAVKWKESVTFFNNSSDSAVRFQWTIDGNDKSDSAHFVFTPTDFGKYEIGLAVWDKFSQRHFVQKTVSVQRPPKPTASFSMGVDKAKVGDKVRITDTSSGDLDKVVYKIDGFKDYVINSPFTHEKKKFDIDCKQVGNIRIVQVAYGPGGTSRSENILVIKPKFMKPVAAFSVDVDSGSGPKVVRFINESTGDVQMTIFDPDDGSPVQYLSGLADVEYEFGPGTYSPKLKVIAMAGTGFEPSIWEAGSIKISKPMPAWQKNLFWQIPIGIILALTGAFFWNQHRSIQLAKQDSLLAGEVMVRPVDEPRAIQRFTFSGTSDEEVVELADEKTLRLHSSLDDDDGEISYSVEMRDGDMLVSNASFEPETEFQIGDFLVRYSA